MLDYFELAQLIIFFQYHKINYCNKNFHKYSLKRPRQRQFTNNKQINLRF